MSEDFTCKIYVSYSPTFLVLLRQKENKENVVELFGSKQPPCKSIRQKFERYFHWVLFRHCLPLTLNTFSLLTSSNPCHVDCRLFNACKQRSSINNVHLYFCAEGRFQFPKNFPVSLMFNLCLIAETFFTFVN